METDRDASGGDDLAGRPDPDTPSPESPESHDYGYGQTPLDPAGTGGARAADSGSPEGDVPSAASPAAASSGEDALSTGAETSSAGPESSSRTGQVPATGIRPVTALRTAPRAVLRPVPEGFPTPPPRPARPNRRPAAPQEPAPAGKSRRGVLIAGISVIAVLLLAVVVGGGVLAVRTLSPAAPAGGSSAPSTGTAPEPTGPGQVQIGEATITEVSTEVGVRKVGSPGSAMEPEGEYIVVIFEVDNPRDQSLDIGDQLELEAADGQTYAPDSDAGITFEADDSRPLGMVDPGSTVTFHKVYDVPIGTQPTGLHFSFSNMTETGTLPLG
ncbi:hypothetical protein GCM10023160_15000 [Brachybacterium paraconglomeratum]|uniref:DUF4352 domain-containing protein n=1 Tax=Brachybacterium paraconglomeratum TaxID=173362 RepID=UPI0031E88C1E